MTEEKKPLNPVSYTLSFEEKGEILYVYADGVRTHFNVQPMIIEIFDRAVAAGKSRVLVDATNLEGEIRMIDSYAIVTSLFEKLRGRGLSRVALVEKKSRALASWFFETAAQNRGYKLLVFHDTEKAIEWLNKD